MNSLLKLKHWQVFLLLVTAGGLSNFTFVGNTTLTDIISFVGGAFYFFWLVMIGHGLYQLLPRKIELNYNLFVFNCFIWLVAYMALKTLAEGEFKVNGPAAFACFYGVYALIHIVMFPARCLKSYEKDTKADLGECIGYLFLMLFWPIDIWILQPKINKAVEHAENVLVE